MLNAGYCCTVDNHIRYQPPVERVRCALGIGLERGVVVKGLGILPTVVGLVSNHHSFLPDPATVFTKKSL